MVRRMIWRWFPRILESVVLGRAFRASTRRWLGLLRRRGAGTALGPGFGGRRPLAAAPSWRRWRRCHPSHSRLGHARRCRGRGPGSRPGASRRARRGRVRRSWRSRWRMRRCGPGRVWRSGSWVGCGGTGGILMGGAWPVGRRLLRPMPRPASVIRATRHWGDSGLDAGALVCESLRRMFSISGKVLRRASAVSSLPSQWDGESSLSGFQWGPALSMKRSLSAKGQQALFSSILVWASSESSVLWLRPRRRRRSGRQGARRWGALFRYAGE